MPLYTYRREDGTTFDFRQGFHDEPLTVDPVTGQSVVRVVQPAPIIFKGSGFYVNDSRGKTNSTINSPKKSEAGDKAETTAKADAGSGASSAAPSAEAKTPASTTSTTSTAD
jgi:predicted nucleic acid-binding Zn ribbon protein